MRQLADHSADATGYDRATPVACSLGFGVWGLGVGVWGLGFEVSGLGGCDFLEGTHQLNKDEQSLLATYLLMWPLMGPVDIYNIKYIIYFIYIHIIMLYIYSYKI